MTSIREVSGPRDLDRQKETDPLRLALQLSAQRPSGDSLRAQMRSFNVNAVESLEGARVNNLITLAFATENRLRAIRHLPTVDGNPFRLRVVKPERRSPIRSPSWALVSHALRTMILATQGAYVQNARYS